MGVTMALPLLEAMQPLNAWGQVIAKAAGTSATKAPVRFAALYMANGANMAEWRPKGVGRDFELSKTLSPLAGFKDDLLVLTNLWNAATNTGDGH